MFFFYVVDRKGYWAQGFASRFVNISLHSDAEVLRETSVADIGKISRMIGVPMMVVLVFLFVL